MSRFFVVVNFTKSNITLPKKQVPQEIMRPDYAVDGIPKDKSPMLPWVIEVKKEADIEGMRAAGRVARYRTNSIVLFSIIFRVLLLSKGTRRKRTASFFFTTPSRVEQEGYFSIYIFGTLAVGGGSWLAERRHAR